MAGEQDFDLSAAALRADGADLAVSLEVLASKLEQSLPACTHVERRGSGLLGRGKKRVRLLQVDLGGTRYELKVDGDQLEGSRERQVGGISIKREQLDGGRWVSALTSDLREQAEQSSQARAALERLLA